MRDLGKIWDATPVEATQTVTLKVSSGSWWPVIAGFLGGFLVALVLFASAQTELNARAVDRGVFTHDGRAFKLVEMKP